MSYRCLLVILSFGKCLIDVYPSLLSMIEIISHIPLKIQEYLNLVCCHHLLYFQNPIAIYDFVKKRTTRFNEGLAIMVCYFRTKCNIWSGDIVILQIESLAQTVYNLPFFVYTFFMHNILSRGMK